MEIDTKAREKEQLLAGLAMHTGTEHWFQHWTGRFVYTEGVRYLAGFRQRSRQIAIPGTVLLGHDSAPGRGSTADGMRRVRWGSDFGAV